MEDWIKNYPVGSVWNFQGSIWGKGKAIVVAHKEGNYDQKLGYRLHSLIVLISYKDGDVNFDRIYQDQKHILKKQLKEPASVDAFLGWD